MKGTVTIHAGGKKIYEDTNVLTDAGGEIIAEAMSISPSLSGIASASALLDASNYTIQAISFGTGADHYAAATTNAHLALGSGNHYVFIRNGAGLLDPDVTSPHVILALQLSDSGSSSTYVPTGNLPDEPIPMDTRLERGSTAVSGYLLVGSDSYDLSSALPVNGDIGQNINLGPSAYTESILSNWSGWDDLSSSDKIKLANLVRAHYGAYADSSGSLGVGDPNSPINASGSFAYVVSSYDFGGGAMDALVATSSVYSGYFNSASSMDTSGYVTMISTGVNDTTRSSTSGLIIEPSDITFSSTGKIKYQVTIASGDVGATTMYGGIYTMGLWCFDVPATIQDGGVAPFAWDPITHKRKYKLFSKKGFNKNICHHSDWDLYGAGESGMQNVEDLLISWTLDFFGPTV